MKAAALISSGLLVPLLVLAIPAAAATWNVTFDPSDNVDQIGSVVAQTANGDTILVGPGTYYEHIPIPDRALTLIGTDGPGATILDGSQAIAGRQPSVLYALAAHLPSFSIRGFTIRGGMTSYVPAAGRQAGGGLLIYNLLGYGTSPVSIVDCKFSDNTSTSGGSGGGGFYLVNVLSTIENCEFRTNVTADGTHAYVYAGAAAFRSCRFYLAGSIGAYGVAVYSFAGDIELEDCTIYGSSDPAEGESSIYTNGGVTTLRRNQFIDEDVASATVIDVNSGSIIGEGVIQQVLLEGNLFWRRSSAPVPAEDKCILAIRKGYIDVLSNTFINTSVTASLGCGGDDTEIKRNIFAHSGCVVISGCGGMVECNDVWPEQEAMDIRCCGIVLGSQLEADPLFCDPLGGDFHVAESSPCAPSASPLGCDVIGAFDVGCSPTPVERVTWGHVKGLFR